MLTETIEQRRARIDLQIIFLAIHAQGDGNRTLYCRQCFFGFRRRSRFGAWLALLGQCLLTWFNPLKHSKIASLSLSNLSSRYRARKDLSLRPEAVRYLFRGMTTYYSIIRIICA